MPATLVDRTNRMESKKGLRLNASAGMNVDGEPRGTKGDIEFPY